MKININKSAKRILSLVLAFAMLVGCLFTANVGININASAETTDTTDYSTWRIEYWDGTKDAVLTGKGTKEEPYMITNASELYWVCTGAGGVANGKYYKVDPEINAFVLQPNTVITDLAAFLAKDAKGVNDFFASTTPINWIKSGYEGFNGNFDGSGVQIYGLYANSVAVDKQNAALFPAVDGGVLAGNDGEDGYYMTAAVFDSNDGQGKVSHDIKVYYDNDGITIENFALSHSYFTSSYRLGTVFADSNSSAWGSGARTVGKENYLIGVEGVINLKTIEVSNCYLLGTSDKGVGAKGVFVGNSGANDVLKASNCFIHNNYGIDDNNNVVSKLGLYGTLTGSQERNKTVDEETITEKVTATMENMAVYDTSIYRSTDLKGKYVTYTNVYTDQGVAADNSVITVPDTPIGLHAPLAMSNLTWATSDNAGAEGVWYATKGEYPTVIMPKGWSYEDAVLYEEGDGSANNPYRIYTGYQLWKMVTDTTVGNYYKVADGVDAIYLSNVGTKDEAKAMYALGSYFNWFNASTTVTDAFNGHFDGNGATIYGMISKGSNNSARGRVGFVKSMGYACTASIKNVNFDSCYVYSTGNAAIITTDLGNYTAGDSYAEITTVTVRNSRIESANTPWLETAESVVSTQDENGTTVVESCTYTHSIAGYAAGFVAPTGTNDMLTISNCIYDGYSCELVSPNVKVAMDATWSSDAKDGSYKAGDYKWTKDEITAFNMSFGTSYSDETRATFEMDMKMQAGIYSASSSHNDVTITDCISLGASVMPQPAWDTNALKEQELTADEAIGAGFTNDAPVKITNSFRYVNKNDPTTTYNNSNKVRFYDSYSTEAEYFETQVAKAEENLDVYDKSALPLLYWFNWELTEVEDDRIIPMPTGVASDNTSVYSQQIADSNNGSGANKSGYGYDSGTYGMYQEFTGAGTESDPYLITNALQLAQAIACGGKNLTQKLYYKLACDIDLGGVRWINQNPVTTQYTYVPFEGILDGAGYVITGLYATDEKAAGLIPVLNGGTVKDVHIRNSYAGSHSSAALIVGSGTGTIENCSVEGSEVAAVTNATSNYIANGITATDSYYTTTDDNGTTTATYIGDEPADTALYPAENAEWYMGTDGIARHLSAAKAHTVTDVNADGIFEDWYTTADLTALRKCLVGNDAYEHIFGDVNNDGVTNMRDLAVIRREMVDDRNDIRDGFWHNAEKGNIVIYYGENDNYDAARKLEIALEAAILKSSDDEVDIKKVVVANSTVSGSDSNSEAVYVHAEDIDIIGGAYGNGTDLTDEEKALYALDGKLQIVVGDIPGYTSKLDANTYSITKDEESCSVCIQGENFTAVEQAVIDFILNSVPSENTIYSIESAKLDEKKWPKVVGDTTYYYAWGDEFDSAVLDTDTWNYGAMQNETSRNEAGATGKYFTNLEVAFPEDLSKLYSTTDEDGKPTGYLTINRGYYADSEYTSANTGWVYLGTLDGKLEAHGADLSTIASGETTNNSGNFISNNFGGRVEKTDIYATAGKIDTKDSILAKQGYLEMKVSYPSDGHVFACWWLMGYTGDGNPTNSSISKSLFSKAFKLNNAAAYGTKTDVAAQYAWNGADVMDSRYPNTFKYQLPNSTFEIDIVELMQATDTAAKANYTFHKFYSNGVYTNNSGEKAIKFLKWDNILSGSSDIYHTVVENRLLSYDNVNWVKKEKNTGITAINGTSNTDTNYQYDDVTVSEFLTEKVYSSTKTSINTDITTKETTSWSITYVETTTTTTYGYEYVNGMLENTSDAGKYFSGTPYKIDVVGGETYTFAVKWDATNDAALYTFYVYDEEGKPVVDPMVVAEDITYSEDDNSFLAQLSKIATDKSNANQYMYMLIDNTYYTSTSDGTSHEFEDMLNSKTNQNRADMVIDYVRIYQNKRDLITPETEAFNNGNHFGY